MHVSLKLLLLSLAQFGLVIQLHREGRKVINELVFLLSLLSKSLHRESALLPVCLLLLQHLVKLLLAPRHQQLAEIHLWVVCIVEALEEVDAKAHVVLKIVRLCR